MPWYASPMKFSAPYIQLEGMMNFWTPAMTSTSPGVTVGAVEEAVQEGFMSPT